jgi:prepilin-type N-terminal cleavage/methylation domain-containing protein
VCTSPCRPAGPVPVGDFAEVRGWGGDGGFTLLETLVSLALMGTVMAATGTLLVGQLRTAGVQRDRQTAVHLVDDAVERVWALGRAGLLEGRSQAAVQSQWAQAPASVRSAYASTMLCAWDPKLSTQPAAACNDTAAVDNTAPGAQAPLPTAPIGVTVAGVRYQQNWYVGECWLAFTAGARCLSTASTAQDVTFMRVVVAVTWPDRSCTAGLCVYDTTTLVSPASDPVFSLW